MEQVCRAIEGFVYADIGCEMAAVEALLAELAADPTRVRSLVGWAWIIDVLAQLPA